MKALIVVTMLLLLSSCYFFKDGSVPLETISYPHNYTQQSSTNKNTNAKKLMILLPGIGDTAGSFDQHNFIDAIRKVNPDIDVVAVDAHFKYYQNRTIVERLRKEIVKPARAAGYREIYFGGISLGGFGSLLYIKQFPNEIDKIFILAPYLGEKEDFEYLLENESAPKVLRDQNMWPWLTALPPKTKAKIFLAYGSSDKFATENELLAKQLPKSHVVLQTGEHNWDTWKNLWPELLLTLQNKGDGNIAAQK